MSEPVCPYCRAAFEDTAPAKIFCTACGTPHHEDCYLENGGCTVFGCSRAPADDPKLQVSQSDLRAVVVPVQPSVPIPPYPVQQYPPPAYSGPLGLSQPAPGPRPPAGSSAAPPPGANAYAAAPPNPSPYQHVPPVVAYRGIPKNRTTYIVLGIFLGALGIHNFYAGYTGRAVGQLCLSLLTLGYLALASWIWAIVEICIVDKDSAGIHFS
jgi:TM2 domain-containing membrane protein YozV